MTLPKFRLTWSQLNLIESNIKQTESKVENIFFQIDFKLRTYSLKNQKSTF